MKQDYSRLHHYLNAFLVNHQYFSNTFLQLNIFLGDYIQIKPDSSFNIFNQTIHYIVDKESNNKITSANLQGSGAVDSFGFHTVETKLPVAGSCFTWKGTHYKTFDGQVYR